LDRGELFYHHVVGNIKSLNRKKTLNMRFTTASRHQEPMPQKLLQGDTRFLQSSVLWYECQPFVPCDLLSRYTCHRQCGKANVCYAGQYPAAHFIIRTFEDGELDSRKVGGILSQDRRKNGAQKAGNRCDSQAARFQPRQT